MKKKLLLFSLSISSVLFAQTVVSVGSGSYASFPPASEGNAVTTFTNLSLNVPAGNTKPIPTNDWWTQVLTTPIAGNLWAYPIVLKPQNYGAQLFFPTAWAANDMVKDYPLAMKGAAFNPAKNIAKTWHDWGLTINMQDGAKAMDITIGNGFPMAWFEISGFDPFIEFGAGVTFFKLDGSAVSFPYTANCIGALYRGKYYGIYAPNNTLFTLSGSTVTMKNQTVATYFTVATLTAKTDLTYFNTYAYSIPRDTKVSWDYQPANAKIDITWTITADNLQGGPEKRVVQGFLPHQYKDCTTAIAYNGKEYATPRGLLKCAAGNAFTFSYQFNGVLAHSPLPTVQAEANYYDPAKMKTMTDNFSSTVGYGNDSYWGGKDLLNYAKYALMAKETGNSNYAAIKQKSLNSLSDWLTYTPGETEHYFARYDKWKALIGFNSSFGSEQFTDNHFHYGYLTYSSALLGMIDKTFLTQYGPMIKQVAKQYANWDRNDLNYPFLRTMSPWRGHSMAGGTSSGDGNNQESTSEAMQAWAGLLLLGDLMGDNTMRDAGAFGYLTESRATKEYWFDVDNQNLPSTYPHSMVGIVFDGGLSYGTWFSGDPLHIHAIQWLPWAPIMNYMAQYPTYLKNDYTLMKAEQQTKFGKSDESDFGSDWANVALCYEQMYDPAYASQRFDEYWAAASGSNYNKVATYITAGQSYYYMHSHRSMGDIQWNCHTTAPNSQVYYNSITKKYSYVGFNSSSNPATVNIYKDGVAQGSINVAAYSFFNRQDLDVINNVNIIESEKIALYPNPFNDVAYIQTINDNDQIESIEVYNSIGAMVEKRSILPTEKSIQMGQKYASGTYLIHVKGNFGNRTYRLIKM